jgi:hypothetical protein
MLQDTLPPKNDTRINTISSIRGFSWLKLNAWHLLIPIVFFAIGYYFLNSRNFFEFSLDEGLNLMKAMLLKQGYSLYGEIWSDQPPLLTYLTLLVFRFWGFEAAPVRLMVLFTSSMLLWAAFEYMRLVWGNASALIGVILIALLPKYLILSVSVMEGLPAISFAMVALLALAFWHKRHRYLFLVLSAIALSLSILIKLFTGLLAPVFVTGILIGGLANFRIERSWRDLLLPPAVWILVFGIVAAGLGLALTGMENLPQLLETHLDASGSEAFDQVIYTINYFLKPLWYLIFLALVGTLITIRSRLWLGLYPLAWIGVAYVSLYFHRPVWVHHQLLITIPAATLASIAIYEALSWSVEIFRPHIHWNTGTAVRVAALSGLILLVFTIRQFEPYSLLRPNIPVATDSLELGEDTEKFVKRMVQYAPQSKWVITDLPMYAFKSGLPVPPNLAVFSLKRFASGNLTENDIIQSIKEYNPEQILLGRQDYPLIEDFLKERYTIIYTKGMVELYLRNDIEQ